MSLRSRILRYAGAALALLLLAGYAAFTTFFFNPLEGELKADIASLVPRDVDFFLARSDLDRVFGRFPRLAVEERLEKHAAWQSFAASPEGADLARSLNLEETLAELSKATGQLPLGLQPQDLFGGRDLALAGYFRGADLARADWAVYGKANWAGKLAAEALRHPGWFRLEERGLETSEKEGVVTVSGGGLTRLLHVARVRDVVIVATHEDLARRALALPARGHEDSFFLSAAYHDYIQKAYRSERKDEIELYVHLGKLAESLALPAPWPDPKSPDFAPALLGRMFQLGHAKNAIGVIGIDEGIAIDLHGDVASERITPEQERLYRTRGSDRAAILNEAARLAPRDSALFAVWHAPTADLLRMILASFEPALRQNLEDAFRSTGKYPNLDKLVAELDSAVKGRMALIVRQNDYPPDPGGPPHDDTPVPAVALVMWTKNVEPINALRELIGGQGSRFGLQGRTPNEPGFFKNEEAGYETREYWSTLVRGTGVIVTANAVDMTVVTNSLGMMGHILKTYTQGGERYPRLSDDPRFAALVNSALPKANFLLWANPREAAPILRARARRVAEDSIVIDWTTERARVEDEVIRERLPGKRRGGLTPEEQETIDAIVDPKLDAIRAQVRAEQVPVMMARQERWISWSEGVTGALLVLSLDPKSFDLSLRVLAPLESP